MTTSPIAWLRQQTTQYLLRGCADPDQAESRRQSALHNITGFVGRLFALVLAGVNFLSGEAALGWALLAAGLAMSLAVRVHHRTKNPQLGSWLGIITAVVLFLYVLATGGSGGSGHVWLPLLPLLAMFNLGLARGAGVSVGYLLAAAAILLVPDLPGVSAQYSTAVAARLLIATTFAALVAAYYEHTRIVAQARARAENEERCRAEAEVRRASEAKSQLLAAVSHEMRTPLTAVMGLHDLLLQTNLDSTQRSYLELATRTGHGLVAVIGDLLDLSKVEAGKLRIAAVPFDLRELVAGLIEVQQVLLQGKPVTINLAWDEAAPVTVIGDPTRIQQVLGNLIGNAIKFTAEGQIVVRVGATAVSAESATLTIAVEDSGVGLSAEQQTSVFEAFVQTGTTHEGCGLGLTIARSLVEAMGGEVAVRSELGKGSTFWFELTFRRPAAETAETVETRAPLLEAHWSARVLLVEDNDLNRDVLRIMLERLGCTVDIATNGEEAVVIFARRDYDLVLMDCQMPVLDGFSATARIRTTEHSGRHTPIIAITAYALPEELRRCLDAGMDDHITKPIVLDEMVSTIGRWLPPGAHTSA